MISAKDTSTSYTHLAQKKICLKEFAKLWKYFRGYIKMHFRIIPNSKQVYWLPQTIVHHHTGDRDQGFYQRKVPISCTVSVSADGSRSHVGRWSGTVVQWGCPLCTLKPKSESTWTNLVNGKYKETLSCMSLWFTLATYTSERCEARDGIFKLLRSPGIESKESIPPAYVTWRAGTAREEVFMEGPLEPNMGPSLADVLLCTFQSTNTGFSSFPVRKLLSWE